MSTVSSAPIPIAPASLVASSGNAAGHPMPPAASDSSAAAAKTKSPATDALWMQSLEQIRTWSQAHLLHINIQQGGSAASATSPQDNLSGALENLLTAIQAVELRPVPDASGNDATSQEETAPSPPRKRRKRQRHVLVDPYRIWVHVKRNEEDDSDDDSDLNMPLTLGAKLVALSIGGILNGMALVEGGVTTQPTPSAEALKSSAASTQVPVVLALLPVAHAWHAAVQKQVEHDIIAGTPSRIREHLCPEYNDKEFANIRKRVYKTAVLGEGLHTDEAGVDKNLVTGVAAMSHEIKKHKKCPSCGNTEQQLFVTDRKNGDIICSNCGTVVSDALMHEGSAYRKFEGEIDRNHHGDAPNPLFSNAYNLSTSLSGVAPTTGAGVGGWRSGGSRGGSMETLLKNAHSTTEHMLSRIGKNKDDKTTTEYTKDEQKREAFAKMRSTADALDLHDAVIERARKLFSAMRDDRISLQDSDGVIAGCLVLAFEELSEVDKKTPKAAQGEGPDAAPETTLSNDPTAAPTFQYNKRATRRNELHHANLAGKGGLLLDFSSVETKKGGPALSTTPSTSSIGASSSNNAPSNAGGNKNGETTRPVETWDLEDCRRWLTNKAVPQIAEEWVEAREAKTEDGIPNGSKDELEGELAFKTLTLMEYLEKELFSKQVSKRNKVETPRLNDLGKLGIQFQNKRERGAGSKSLPQATKPRRTAGKILMDKKATELGTILEDPWVGTAIHKKLREVLAKQRERERQAQREVASRKHLMQSQGKAYPLGRLQA